MQLVADDIQSLRGEIRRLQDLLGEKDEEILQLRQFLLPPEWEPPIELNLTKQEARLIAGLFRNKAEICSKEKLYYILYHDKEDQVDLKIIDVFICKARKKLAPYGLEIKTVWGQGYHFDKESLDIIANWGIDPNESIIAKSI